MNENKKNKPKKTDEIGGELETGSEANTVIKQQGDDAAVGIPRDSDAAKHERRNKDTDADNAELTGAP